MRTRIAAWTESNNTFPALASHPQRVVGWASLTLNTSKVDTTSLDAAHEYAGHAQIHLTQTRQALASC